jgi:threonine dehydrogenase-like Zn-dependent dehydrogenase
MIKGASRVIGIDRVPARLAFAQKLGLEVIDFSKHSDVTKAIYELVPRGLDVAIDCGMLLIFSSRICPALKFFLLKGTFHEPKTIMHKIQKVAMLETDVPETINEMIVSVRKMGRCGIIAAYAGFANGVNVGALMEKGVR